MTAKITRFGLFCYFTLVVLGYLAIHYHTPEVPAIDFLEFISAAVAAVGLALNK